MSNSLENKSLEDVTDFTNTVSTIDNDNNLKEVIGNGVFDIMMSTITKHIDAQFVNGRIRGEQYAMVYVQLIQYVLQTALEIVMDNRKLKENDELEKYKTMVSDALERYKTDEQMKIEGRKLDDAMTIQKPVSDASVLTEGAKKALYERQTKGFNDDAKIKTLKELTTAWGLGFAVASDDPNLVVPKSLTSNVIDNLVTDIIDKSNLGSMSNGSIGFSSDPYSSVTPR